MLHPLEKSVQLEFRLQEFSCGTKGVTGGIVGKGAHITCQASATSSVKVYSAVSTFVRPDCSVRH